MWSSLRGFCTYWYISRQGQSVGGNRGQEWRTAARCGRRAPPSHSPSTTPLGPTEATTYDENYNPAAARLRPAEGKRRRRPRAELRGELKTLRLETKGQEPGTDLPQPLISLR